MNSEIIKVLLIDGDEDDYALTRDLLSRVKIGEYVLDWASSYEEGLKVARRREHHVCLVEYRLGERNGVQLIQEARKSRLTTPMILLTGAGDRDLDVEAMLSGATDFLIKDETSATRFERTIRYAVQLNTERCNAEQELAVYAQKQAAVAEIGRLALIGGELKDFFAEAVALVATTLNLRYCNLLELRPDGDTFELRAGVGWKKEYAVGIARISASCESQAGFALLSDEPVIVNDWRTETRFSRSPLLDQLGVLSGMNAIIRGPEKAYGVLGAHSTSLRVFADDDINFLMAVANVLAEAIARKNAEDDIRQSSDALRESERRHRELVENATEIIYTHDLTGNFTSLNKAGEVITGYTFGKDLVNIMQLVAPEYRETARRKMLGRVASGEQSSYATEVIEIIAKDRRRIALEGSSRLILKDGVAVGVQGITRDISERKRAEEEKAQLTEEIESQRQRVNNVVASVPGVVWEIWSEPDAATQRINYVSDYMETMLGYTREEYLSAPDFWLSVVHEDDRERIAASVAASLTTEDTHSTNEFRWIAKDGRVLWVESKSSVTRDNDGRPLGLRGVTIDVTERKNAEEALRESEGRYRLLFASNPVPMWVYDLETLFFLAVNDAAILHYGYSREEFLSMTLKDIRPLEDKHGLLKNVSRMNTGTGLAGYWRHRKKDGEIINVEISSHELVYGGARAELVLANDVTERLRIQKMEERRASQVALRTDIIATLAERNRPMPVILKQCAELLVEHLDAAFARIWTLNKDENVLELQASAGMYTHIDGPYSRVPVGKFKIGLIAEERISHITNEVQSDPRVGDKEWAKREGMVSFAGFPLLVEDRLVGVMALFARHKLAGDTIDALASVADFVSVDIERKRVEEALRVTEDQLRQSQRLESVGMLAGGIAHDFNNLLTVITGYSELTLMRLDSTNPLIQNVREIKKAADRAASLTRQLLAFSRKQVLQPKVFDLNSVIVNIEKMLGRLVGEDMELRASPCAGLSQVKADPGQIEQVILNLVVNARDAMPKGGMITLETANVYLDKEYARRHLSVVPGWYAMLAVTDTGHGMDAELKKHIFEPFFTTKEQGKGTGLGLSTVYGIVKQSGGNIWVYSEVGVGTTFKIFLPLVNESVMEPESEAARLHNAAGTETILLAEDEEMVRNLASESLRMHGYKVLEAPSASDALLICQNHDGPIHLLLTDVVMPRMSGKDLAEQLVKLRPDTPVLYMSGYTDHAIVHHGILDGDITFIGKPFTPYALVRKVVEVLQRNPILNPEVAAQQFITQ